MVLSTTTRVLLLMATIDRTLRYSARCFFREDHNPNVNFRQLSTESVVKVLTRTRTGVSLPKYRDVIAKHGNATTALSGQFMSLDADRGRGYYLVYHSGLKEYYEGEIYGDIAAYYSGVPNFTPFSNVAQSRAAAQWLAKVRKVEVSVSGPTFLGEIRDTLKMLRKPAGALQEGIQRYLDELKRVNAENKRRYFNKQKPRYIRNLSHIASGLWLERAFGWLPLMNDIKDSINAYNNLFEIDRTVKVSAGGHDAKLRSQSNDLQLLISGGWLNFRVDARQTDHVVVRYRGAVNAQAVSTASDRYAQFGFTPSEFIPTAWEVLPWSFLADYFVNIGDLLSASVTDTSKVAWVTVDNINKADVTRRYTFDRDRLEQLFGKQNIIRFVQSPSFARWRNTVVTRSNSGVPMPTLSFYLPRSDGRLLNVAALMTQCGIDLGVAQRLSGRTWRN